VSTPMAVMAVRATAAVVKAEVVVPVAAVVLVVRTSCPPD